MRWEQTPADGRRVFPETHLPSHKRKPRRNSRGESLHSKKSLKCICRRDVEHLAPSPLKVLYGNGHIDVGEILQNIQPMLIYPALWGRYCSRVARTVKGTTCFDSGGREPPKLSKHSATRTFLSIRFRKSRCREINVGGTDCGRPFPGSTPPSCKLSIIS